MTKIKENGERTKKNKPKKRRNGGSSWLMELKDQNGRSILECKLAAHNVDCQDISVQETVPPGPPDFVSKAQARGADGKLATQDVTPSGGTLKTVSGLLIAMPIMLVAML